MKKAEAKMSDIYSVKRIHQGRMPQGSDLLNWLTSYLGKNGINAATISIIGAASAVKLGAYDFKEGRYKTFDIEDEVEILSCVGNVSLLEGNPFAHLHMIVGEGDGRTRGGHVFEGCRVIVAEYQICEFAGDPAERTLDPATGLKLWKAEQN